MYGNDLSQTGQFRANPEANLENATRLVDPTNPGTAGTDSGNVDTAGASVITGVNYVGKDGNSQFIQFFQEDQLTQKRLPYSLAAGSTAKAIQDAILDILRLHEVGPIISVVKTGSVLAVEHTGSGTIQSVVVDGANVALSRVAVSGLAEIAEEPEAEEPEVSPKEGGQPEAGSPIE